MIVNAFDVGQSGQRIYHWFNNRQLHLLQGKYPLYLCDYTYDIVLVFIIATIVTTWLMINYYKRKYSFWSSLGVSTPKPWLIFGNSFELIWRNRAYIELEWPKRYGRVYGFYQGTKPVLAVADPDVIKTICVKDFHAFPNRHFNDMDFMNYHQQKFMSLLRDQHWRRVRNIISPTFSSGKMKRMFKLLDSCCDELIQLVGERAQSTDNNIIDCKDTLGLYTMNGITTCFYAIRLHLTKDDCLESASSRKSLIDNALRMVTPDMMRVLAMNTIPDCLLRLIGFKLTPLKPLEDMAERCRAIIHQRRKNCAQGKEGSKNKYDDYLQILLDAKLSDKFDVDENHYKESHHAGISEEIMIKDREQQQQLHNADECKLTDDEILANTMLFLTVGYDTTVSLLSNAAYALAHHPDIQTKLYEELLDIQAKSKAENGPELDYDSLTAAVYLDSVICETLRLLTPVLWQDRETAQDYHLKEYDIMIPKGTVVNISYYAIHHDSKYWPNPECFMPERFFAENRHRIAPCAYTPFGHGPRHCIGMRFSLTKAKLALARLILKFHLKPAPGTTFPPTSKFSLFINGYESMKIIPQFR